MPGPLDGVLVVSLDQAVAAPFAASDLGEKAIAFCEKPPVVRANARLQDLDKGLLPFDRSSSL